MKTEYRELAKARSLLGLVTVRGNGAGVTPGLGVLREEW